uniref:Uncharacterized protein n=1 Tax=Puccinia triticina (isolate 1-1 / race 1 (BBBD)) TaxID=630390 RepID=A0ABL7CHJ7_PUCT1
MTHIADANNSPGSETAAINWRIPGGWQQARPATPRNWYYPDLPQLPTLESNPAEPVFIKQHFAPLPRSTFRAPLFPPPPPPSLASPPLLSSKEISPPNITVPPSPPSPHHPPPASFQQTSPRQSPPKSPHLPTQPILTNFPLTPIICLLTMDPPPHLTAAKQAADLAEAKAQLEESKIVGQAILLATSKIPDNIILAPDGSNFKVWH